MTRRPEWRRGGNRKNKSYKVSPLQLYHHSVILCSRERRNKRLSDVTVSHTSAPGNFIESNERRKGEISQIKDFVRVRLALCDQLHNSPSVRSVKCKSGGIWRYYVIMWEYTIIPELILWWMHYRLYHNIQDSIDLKEFVVFIVSRKKDCNVVELL